MNNDKHQASTTVLIRINTDPWPHRVLLVKRAQNAVFLPGAHVFPGGRVDQSDRDLSPDFFRNEQLRHIEQQFLSDRLTAQSHLWAAIRETLEESGICILKKGPSEYCTHDELTKILQGQVHDITPCLDNIWPISWWITPKGEARRFDTWFFLALVDNNLPQQLALSHETYDHLWLKPQEALLAHEQKNIFLSPPTRAILERLAKTKSLPDFLSFIDQPLRPIRPYFVPDPADNQKKWLVLPGDYLHHEKEPLKLPMHTRYRF